MATPRQRMAAQPTTSSTASVEDAPQKYAKALIHVRLSLGVAASASAREVAPEADAEGEEEEAYEQLAAAVHGALVRSVRDGGTLYVLAEVRQFTYRLHIETRGGECFRIRAGWWARANFPPSNKHT